MISIIIPVYNSEKHLNKCVESIINQSYSDIEVILVNDGSTDSSGKICDSYVSKDDRFKVIHKENTGPASARNDGIKLSKGKFIFFIDSDDFLEEGALQILVERYEKYNPDLVIADFNKVAEKVTSSGNDRVFSEDRLLKKQDIINYVSSYLSAPNKFPLLTQSWGRLFKASIIKNNNIFFNSDLRTVESVAFNFDYIKHANEIFYIKKPLYNFAIHTDCLYATMNMLDNPSFLFGYQEALLSVEQFLKSCSPDTCFKKELGKAYVCYTIIQLIRLCMQINDNNEKQIYKFICELVCDTKLKDGLKFYSPSGNDSKIIPVLIRLKFAWLIMLMCKYRSKKRYGKNIK